MIDFSLPDMDGLKLIDKIRTIYTPIEFPLIMMTGQGNQRIALEAMKKDISDYLIKGN